MIKHIVFFRFPEFPGKVEFLKEAAGKINELNSKIASVHHIEAGLNFSEREVAWDMALLSDFTSRENLEDYRIHPEHKALVSFLGRYEHEVAVVDFEY